MKTVKLRLSEFDSCLACPCAARGSDGKGNFIVDVLNVPEEVLPGHVLARYDKLDINHPLGRLSRVEWDELPA